jgi:choline dehydrogenase
VGDRSFEAIVVGGGSAGCVAAARLAEQGRRVALIEAGPDFGPPESGRWPADYLDADAAPSGYEWGFPDPSSSRARLVGGCSAHNGCEEMWGARQDYDEWSAISPSLSFAALAPRLREVERRLRVRDSGLDDLLPIRRALINAAQEAGYPVLPRYNDPPSPVGVALTTVNAVGSMRWNAAFAYLDPVRGSGLLAIIDGTLVDRIVFEHGAAVGVEVVVPGHARKRVQLRAPLVVLAAGAYGSPAILQRSGVGDPDLLRALGIEVVAESLGVGQGLIDHPFVHVTSERSAVLAARDRAAARSGRPTAQSVLRWASPHCEPGTWDLTLGAWSVAAPLANDATRDVPAGRAGFSPCVMKPRSRGKVAVVSTDPGVLPLVDHGFLSDPEAEDLSVLVDGVRETLRLAATPTMQTLLRRPLDVTDRLSDAAIAAWVRTNVAGTFHPIGTCRIGRDDDPMAVADGNGRVRGASGLWVLDASAMPTMPRANIHMSVLALAEIIVAGIGEALHGCGTTRGGPSPAR